jgi:hypothetical protein
LRPWALNASHKAAARSKIDGRRAVDGTEDGFMNKLVASLLFVSLGLVAAPSLADQDPPGAFTIKTVTIYGRPNMPHVEIILVRGTAASAAGAAHDDLRARLMAPSEPRGLTH